MKKLIEPAIHLFIWFSLYFLLVVGANTIGVFQKAEGSIIYPITIGTLINIFLFYFSSLYLIQKPALQQNKVRLILLLSGLLLFVTTIESLIDFLFFINIFSTEEEPFGAQLIVNLISNLIVLSLALAYGFTRNWLNNEKQKKDLQQKKIAAELNFLRSQINPHFLFNVLNMAFSSATKSGDERTANIIEKLAGLMRYMLYDCKSESVELEKDIQYIENYITLQKMRLSDEIPVDINFTIQGNYAGIYFAPLILIPFVENAFKHGIKLGVPSEILIELKINDELLDFHIENPIMKTNSLPNQMDSGIGLDNVKRRLLIIYPNRHTLNISDNDEKFNVDLSINLKS